MQYCSCRRRPLPAPGEHTPKVQKTLQGPCEARHQQNAACRCKSLRFLLDMILMSLLTDVAGFEVKLLLILNSQIDKIQRFRKLIRSNYRKA